MTNLASIRKKKGLTCQKLAEYCNISIGAIHSYEQKRLPIESCRLSTLLILSEKLGCTISDLLEDEEIKRRVSAQLVQHAER